MEDRDRKESRKPSRGPGRPKVGAWTSEREGKRRDPEGVGAAAPGPGNHLGAGGLSSVAGPRDHSLRASLFSPSPAFPALCQQARYFLSLGASLEDTDLAISSLH